MAVGMYTGYLTELLGQPISKSDYPDCPHRIWRFRFIDAWISVAVDEFESLAAFSITVMNERFRYRIDKHANRLTDDFILAYTALSALAPGPVSDVEWFIGGHRTRYREMRYYGYPGWYQYFVFSVNDSGVMRTPIDPPSSGLARGAFSDPRALRQQEEIPRSELDRYRALVAPNTLSVLRGGPHDELAVVARAVEFERDVLGPFLLRRPGQRRRWRHAPRRSDG